MIEYSILRRIDEDELNGRTVRALYRNGVAPFSESSFAVFESRALEEVQGTVVGDLLGQVRSLGILLFLSVIAAGAAVLEEAISWPGFVGFSGTTVVVFLMITLYLWLKCRRDRTYAFTVTTVLSNRLPKQHQQTVTVQGQIGHWNGYEATEVFDTLSDLLRQVEDIGLHFLPRPSFLKDLHAVEELRINGNVHGKWYARFLMVGDTVDWRVVICVAVGLKYDYDKVAFLDIFDLSFTENTPRKA